MNTNECEWLTANGAWTAWTAGTTYPGAAAATAKMHETTNYRRTKNDLDRNSS